MTEHAAQVRSANEACEHRVCVCLAASCQSCGSQRVLEALQSCGKCVPCRAGVKQVAQRYVDGNRLQEGMLNRVEALIRCYDPCLSCASHAFGQIPLHIELRDARGQVVDELTRG